MKKYWFGLVLAFLFGTWSLYTTVFFAWLTATPLTQEQLHHAQSRANLWLSLFILSVIGFIVLAIRLVWMYRTRRKT